MGYAYTNVNVKDESVCACVYVCVDLGEHAQRIISHRLLFARRLKYGQAVRVSVLLGNVDARAQQPESEHECVHPLVTAIRLGKARRQMKLHARTDQALFGVQLRRYRLREDKMGDYQIHIYIKRNI